MTKPEPKPFDIAKQTVWEAYLQVKANRGAAGVDGVSIKEFEANLKDNLYKLWNRMSSGSYMPPPVRRVEIPKPGSKEIRALGVPTVADRIAQTAVKMYLEPEVEQMFHPDSYGYRPKRSALDAVDRCRRRCWRSDWVIDLDIKSFFDTIDHELILKAVRRHTSQRWVILYVERWLKAPLQQEDGTLLERESGSPQGSAISPLLANIFMHYAFDLWMARKHPGIQFERYCDDLVVHCKSERQAVQLKEEIGQRLAHCKLELHPAKTKIVYCKDDNRKGPHEHEQFDFLGYTFRPRRARSRYGNFVNFSPAISNKAAKAIRREIRRWRLHRRSKEDLGELAESINAIVRGWINYYGCFYRSAMAPTLKRIDDYLIRWARKKYKRLRRSHRQTYGFLADVAKRQPKLFAHWQITWPSALSDGSRVR